MASDPFACDAYPAALRSKAWSDVLAHLGLSPIDTVGAHLLSGFAWLRDAASGARFGHLRGTPQLLAPVPPPARGAAHVVLIVVHSGIGRIRAAGCQEDLSSGDALLLDLRREWRIELRTDFVVTVAVIADAGFSRRIVDARVSDVCFISRSGPLGGVAADFVRSVGERLVDLEPADLAHVESVLTGMAFAGLAPESGTANAEAATTSVQLGSLRRVCQLVEARLGDPALDIASIAESARLSQRYVQRLFSSAGTTFGAHLRKRRLHRCRGDLLDSSLQHFTISELCFRWGFTDPANFSRAFTQEFGLSPRACRTSTDRPEPVRLRGRPDAAGSPSASGCAVHTSLRRIIDEQFDHEMEPVRRHHHIAVSAETVHWGYCSRALEPVARVRSGDRVTIETLTQHAADDAERMIKGDPGAESVFRWDADGKAVERRGAGPMDASIFGRGAGEGFGVHVCTGPVFVEGAEPGDLLEVRVLDIEQRPSRNPEFLGRSFGSNAATWWGYHYHDLLTEPRPREVVTLYELHATGHENFARAVYSFRWTPQTDPSGVRHDTIDYPGVPVDHASIDKQFGVLAGARIPLRPHFGVLAVAPRQAVDVDSIPPGCFGGNLDNWRAAPGASLFLPVAVPGALFSVGDPHASQGDSELCGTAIECSLTGTFDLVVHKAGDLAGSYLAELDHPFLETPDEWVIQGLSHPNHLVELGPTAQTEVYKRASLDLAMRDAFRKTRRFLMTAHGLSEDEAISLMSVAIDFGVTQVVNGNLGVHAIVRKSILAERAQSKELAGLFRMLASEEFEHVKYFQKEQESIVLNEN